jgi:hypothetical protein
MNSFCFKSCPFNCILFLQWLTEVWLDQLVSLWSEHISNNQTIEFQGAYLPFLVDLASFICSIEDNEFDSNSQINNLFGIIMKCRDLDATDRILSDFIFDHLMHIHLADICRNNSNMIAIVAVQPNLILGRQYLFAPQIEPSVVICWQNMTYWSKRCPFSFALKLRFKEIFTKEKNRPSKFLWRQPLVNMVRSLRIGIKNSPVEQIRLLNDQLSGLKSPELLVLCRYQQVVQNRDTHKHFQPVNTAARSNLGASVITDQNCPTGYPFLLLGRTCIGPFCIRKKETDSDNPSEVDWIVSISLNLSCKECVCGSKYRVSGDD